MDDEAYLQDLRDRVIAAVAEEGLSRRESARRYRIGEATAVRWLQAVRQGRHGPRAQGGDRRSRLPAHEAWLLALIEAEPDLTLAAVAERLLGQNGVRADAGMLSRFFTGRGISFKKKRPRLRAAPPSSSGLTWRPPARYGGQCSRFSAPSVWSSLTRAERETNDPGDHW